MERKFTYAFAAVSPHGGIMDSLILPWVNAETMSRFLATVAEPHADEFIIMLMNQAGWHIAADLVVPKNMTLVFLPPYSPELTPAERLWKALRKDRFANIVFTSLDAAEDSLTKDLVALESNPIRTQDLERFDWITSIPLNTN